MNKLRKLRNVLRKIIRSEDYQIADEGEYELVCPECIRKKEIAEKGLEDD
jgi:hypothetical protein